jgi:nucleotide-binding universal stress UspA family protein
MKRILVPTDFSPASDRAIEQATELARALPAEVHLLHKVVYPEPHAGTELLDRPFDAARFENVLREVLERPEREAREALDSRRARLERDGLRVSARLETSGDVYERIESAIDALKPDLVVMGTHGRSGVRKWLMGSVAEKTLRHAACDVMTLHADSPIARAGSGEKILVATDFSDGARRALDTARKLAGPLRAKIVLLHVLEERFAPGRRDDGEIALVEVSAEHRARAEKALGEEIASEGEEALLREGEVVREIERAADEKRAGIVVVGTHGLGAVRRVLLGSAAEKVARFCRLPVLVAR